MGIDCWFSCVVLFRNRLNPSWLGWTVGWWILLQSFLINWLKSDRISKLSTSLAVGINDNPLLSKSFSGVDNTYPKRFKIKCSAQITQLLIARYTMND